MWKATCRGRKREKPKDPSNTSLLCGLCAINSLWRWHQLKKIASLKVRLPSRGSPCPIIDWPLRLKTDSFVPVWDSTAQRAPPPPAQLVGWTEGFVGLVLQPNSSLCLILPSSLCFCMYWSLKPSQLNILHASHLTVFLPRNPTHGSFSGLFIDGTSLLSATLLFPDFLLICHSLFICPFPVLFTLFFFSCSVLSSKYRSKIS